MSNGAICAGARQDRSSPYKSIRHVALAGNILLAGYVMGFGVWSAFAPLESAAVAPGVLEAETSRKTLQHLEGGIVREILVTDGDLVKAGQPLIRLDMTKARAERESLRGQYWDAKAREARLLAERSGAERMHIGSEFEANLAESPDLTTVVSGHQEILESRREVFRSQAALIDEKIAQVEKEIAGLSAQEAAATKRAEIAYRELAAVQTLVEKGLERRPRLLVLEREIAELEGRVGELRAQISRARQAISEAKTTLLNLSNNRQNEVAQQLRETQNLILVLGERLRAVEDQLARTELRAPEAGVVTDLRVRTPGGVIGAGAPVMDLIPQGDELVVTARVRPEDIDVVHAGLSADVHVLAYSQRRVPSLSGVVSYVSADRLLDKRTDQPYYAARITVEHGPAQMAEEVKLVAGMPAQVLIKTGRSTAAIYALRPLLDSFRSAFRED
jgi:HlyD family secretion protein